MAKNDLQMNLRIPADLKKQIVDAAKKNKRSSTAEVIARLNDTFNLAGAIQNCRLSEEMDLFTEQIADKVVRKLATRE